VSKQRRIPAVVAIAIVAFAPAHRAHDPVQKIRPTALTDHSDSLEILEDVNARLGDAR